ncbi:alginate lyase family protein [Cystobacter fuscus]|uniref:alginate lyase family protein n=1 Tax=Cystobacter fuscus TaxID=43 RepID=UPI002B2CBCC1|nr:hypothetical protein F0U63_48225 [Cystobacter fuscus]
MFKQASPIISAMDSQAKGDGLVPKELKRNQFLHHDIHALQPVTAMAEVACSAWAVIYNMPASQKLGRSLVLPDHFPKLSALFEGNFSRRVREVTKWYWHKGVAEQAAHFFRFRLCTRAEMAGVSRPGRRHR